MPSSRKCGPTVTRPSAPQHADRAIAQTEAEWTEKAKSREKRERLDGLFERATLSLIRDPAKPLTPEEETAFAREGADGVHALSFLRQFREAQLQRGHQITEDRSAIVAMVLRIDADPSRVTARQIFEGVLSGHYDVDRAMSLWQRKRDMAKASLESVAMHDPILNALRDGVYSAIRGNEDGEGFSARAYDAGFAKSSFLDYVLHLEKQGKALHEIRAEMRTWVAETLRGYNPTGASESKAAKATNATTRSESAPGVPPEIRAAMRRALKARDFEFLEEVYRQYPQLLTPGE
jgi:hypothetical protein